MKTSLIFLLLISPLSFPYFIEVEVDAALQFLKSEQTSIQEISTKWTSPTEEVMAIISPELIRHHLLRDFFETQALEVAYVNFGKETADFSIGYFQMKPSFIEKLEDYLSQQPISSSSTTAIITFPRQDDKSKRRIRVDRLKTFEWQLRYAHAFYQALMHRFPHLCELPAQERVAFGASAYNLGFDESAQDILEWRCTEAFPYGKKYQGSQVTYADLALVFYERFTESGPDFDSDTN